MAMTTYFQMVTSAELAALEAEPTTINQLDQPDEQCAATQLQCTLAYFLCGDAYPDPTASALAAAIAGEQSVDTDTLENGAFYLVRPERVADAAREMAQLDLQAIRSAVQNAELEELVDEEELYDLEPWIYDDTDMGQVIVDEVKSLRDFCERAAAAGFAVALYTT
jgi:hypothetical protein